MKKIYTIIFCIGLLVPNLAQAEICTDFDDDLNVIEYDCSEGIKNARKRSAVEQVELYIQGLKDHPWRFFVGGGTVTETGSGRNGDAFMTDDMYGSAVYTSGSILHLTLSTGVRRYFGNANWYSQLAFTYHIAADEEIVVDSYGFYDDPKISKQSFELSAYLGRNLSFNWSIYAKLGMSSSKYKTENWSLQPLESTDVKGVVTGVGMEYRWYKNTLLYFEGTGWLGNYPYSSYLLGLNLGIRFLF